MFSKARASQSLQAAGAVRISGPLASSVSDLAKCWPVKSVTLVGAVSLIVKKNYCCLRSVKMSLNHLHIPLSRRNDAYIVTQRLKGPALSASDRSDLALAGPWTLMRPEGFYSSLGAIETHKTARCHFQDCTAVT
jgi:hypothetical protein